MDDFPNLNTLNVQWKRTSQLAVDQYEGDSDELVML